MLRIAIVEDEELYIRQIEEYIERYSKENEIEITTVIFRDGAEIIKNYQNVYDIIFLILVCRRWMGWKRRDIFGNWMMM